MIREKKRGMLFYVSVFIVPVIILIAVTAANNLYPFGTRNWLLWDADIQYADYFLYLKKVLTNEAEIGYSFSKSLGGSLVGVFAYYLASPLNFFVVFFKDSEIPLFIYIITLIKVGLCGLTAGFFFRHYNEKIRQGFAFLLALGYALMQYTFAQMSNVMWLDGVIMLPLLLHGVNCYLRKKSAAYFSLSVMLSIIFNWYTAYMNCLFVVIYYLWQYASNFYTKKHVKIAVIDFAKFIWMEFLGVLGSCVLFLPTVLSLSTGKSVFDSRIFNINTNYEPIAILEGFIVGTNPGVKEIPSFFCGTLMVAFALYFLIFCKTSIRRKVAAIVFIGTMLAVSYFNVLENLFNGMRFVYSYPYRFNYLIILAFLLLAAEGMAYFRENDNKKVVFLLGIMACTFCLACYVMPLAHPKYLWVTEGVFFLLALTFLLKSRQMIYLLCVVGCLELAINGYLVLRIETEGSGSASVYKNYVENASKQHERLKKYDTLPFYRVEQTLGRKSENDGSRIHASYSESMAYDYCGVSQYTSSYDAKVSEFISALGYSDEIDLTIYDEPILASDALLGVKYVLSDIELPYYELQKQLGEYNGKQVYKNPYALTIGFRTAATIQEKIVEENPFLYQNQLFSAILGRKIELYKPITATFDLQEGSATYYINGGKKEGIIYGYARTGLKNLRLLIDNKVRCNYSTWLSYLVFQVGENKNNHKIMFENEADVVQDIQPVFYYMDMQLFEEIIQELKEHSADIIKISDGYVELEYEGTSDREYLLTTIPYDENWEVLVNGNETELFSGNEALLVIPVEKGKQKIILKYHVSGIKLGVALTMLGLLGIFLEYVWVCRKKEEILQKEELVDRDRKVAGRQ